MLTRHKYKRTKVAVWKLLLDRVPNEEGPTRIGEVIIPPLPYCPLVKQTAPLVLALAMLRYRKDGRIHRGGAVISISFETRAEAIRFFNLHRIHLNYRHATLFGISARERSCCCTYLH